MARVYAARIVGEGGFTKLVALKRMHTHFVGSSQDGTPCIVMELVVGVSLERIHDRMVDTRELVSIPVVAELIAQAAQGLHDAHEAKASDGSGLQIVHRDISPQNVLVGVDGRVRITDFGIARAVLRSRDTTTGRVRGKYGYLSPEQARDRKLDRRSDIFALGIVAWEMLTGQYLFLRANPLETMRAIERLEIPSVRDLRPEVPLALSEVVATALIRDREKRIASARQLALAMRAGAATGFEPPDAAQLSEFVKKWGSAELQKLQDRIRTAATGGRARKIHTLSRIEISDGGAASVAPTATQPSFDAEEELSDVWRPSPTADFQEETLTQKIDVSSGGPTPRAWAVVAVLLAAAIAAAFWLLGMPSADPQGIRGVEDMGVAQGPGEDEAPPPRTQPIEPTVAGDASVSPLEPDDGPAKQASRPEQRPRPPTERDPSEEAPEEPAAPNVPSVAGIEEFERDLGLRQD
jgi:serine/threonine-protein kinase